MSSAKSAGRARTPSILDVLTPIRRFADQAFDRMLPFAGITNRKEQRNAIKTGRLHALARVLQELDWTKLPLHMGEADARSGTAGPDPKS
jgi:hypothetical protein